MPKGRDDPEDGQEDGGQVGLSDGLDE